MRLADFPLFSAALALCKNKHYPGWVEDSLAKLTAGLEAGEIANRHFVDAKQYINRAFEYAWNEYQPDRHNNSPLNTYDRHRKGTLPANEKVIAFLQNFQYPQAHLNTGQIEKIKAFPADPAWAIMLPFLEEIDPICQAIQTLKDKTVKRKVLSDEEKRAAKFAPPASSSKAVEIVLGLLNDIVDAQYQDLVAMFVKDNRKTLQSFKDGFKAAEGDVTKNKPSRWNRETGFEPQYTVAWHFTFKDGSMKGKCDSRAVMLLNDIVDQTSTGYPAVYTTTYAPDADTKLVAQAEKDAKEIRDLFVVKNLRKIVSILEAKGDDNFDSCKVLGNTISLSGLEGTLRFNFKDGSGFTCRNSIVWSISHLGNQFYRFPLTFHNVTMPNGQRMMRPSEKNMNDIFANVTGTT